MHSLLRCLNVCPVYERTGGHAYGSVYPGPIGAILTPMLRGVGHDAATDSLPYASSLCGACYDVCPVAIDIPEVLVHLRSKVVDAHRGRVPHGQDAAMGCGCVDIGIAASLAACRARGVAVRTADVAARRRRAPGGRAVLGRPPWPASKWTDTRDLPAPPTESFRAWWRVPTEAIAIQSSAHERPGRDSRSCLGGTRQHRRAAGTGLLGVRQVNHPQRRHGSVRRTRSRLPLRRPSLFR